MSTFYDELGLDLFAFFKLGFKRALESSKGKALPVEIKVEGGYDYMTDMIEYMKPYEDTGVIKNVVMSKEKHEHVDEDVIVITFDTVEEHNHE